MNRSDILRAADLLVTQERAETYGDASEMHDAIAGAWNWWLAGRLDSPITRVDVAEMMALMKAARRRHRPGHGDSYADGCGYTALAGEFACGRQP